MWLQKRCCLICVCVRCSPARALIYIFAYNSFKCKAAVAAPAPLESSLSEFRGTNIYLIKINYDKKFIALKKLNWSAVFVYCILGSSTHPAPPPPSPPLLPTPSLLLDFFAYQNVVGGGGGDAAAKICTRYALFHLCIR